MKSKWDSIMTKHVQEEIKNFICPDCCGNLTELFSVTRRGDGYISIRGCNSCFKIYYLDVEVPDE